MKQWKALLLTSVMVAGANWVRSEPVVAVADSPADEAQKALATAYVAAVNAKDLDKLKALIHPKCVAAINDDNRDMVSKILDGENKEPIPEDYKLSVEPVRKDQLESMKGYAAFPVQPTHTIKINWFPAKNSLKSRWLFAVKENGTWLDVVAIPTPETVKRFRAQQAAPKKP